MADYEIQKRVGSCFATGRAFEEGETYYAVLMDTPEGFERRDYSTEDWSGPPEGYFSFWKSRVPPRVERKNQLVDNEVILNLFLRLESTEADVKKQFRFVLALILMRKRILKYEHTEHRDQQEYWHMRLVREQSDHVVLNPRLDDEQIASVSDELSAILRGDPRQLDAASDAASETPAPSDTTPDRTPARSSEEPSSTAAP